MTQKTCRFCGSTDLLDIGPQENFVKGTVFDLCECQNPDCPQYGSSRSYDERPMSQAKIDQYIAEGRYAYYKLTPPVGA